MKSRLREGAEKQRKRKGLKRILPKRQIEQIEQDKQVVSIKSNGINYSNQTDTEFDTDTVIDTVIDTDTVSDNENVSDTEITSTKLMPSSSSETKKRHRDFEAINVTAQAIDEASDGEYPYVERLVRKYYEINEERGWIGSDGEPIVDTIKWYKQYLDAELPNGYQVKDIAISEY